MSNSNERAVITVTAWDDLVDRISKFKSFAIDGRVYTSDLLIPMLVVNPTAVIEEASQASAFCLHWGTVAANARSQVARVEAAYRQWRDRTWLEIKSNPISTMKDGSPKFPTDAQSEKMYRVSPEYGVWADRRIESQEAAEIAEAVYEAFRMKKDMVRTMEAAMGHEAGGSYVVVEADPSRPGRQPKLSDEGAVACQK